MTKEIMKAAHKMTKEMKSVYNEIDYKLQLKLNIQYLLELSKADLNPEKAQRMIVNEREVRQRYNQNTLSNNNKLNTEGSIVRNNFKIWAKQGKLRVYYTMNIDGIAVKETYMEIL